MIHKTLNIQAVRVTRNMITQDLGSCAAMRGGSSPFSRTKS